MNIKRIITNIIFYVSLFFAILFIVSALPIEKGPKAMVVLSGSMRPVFAEGDLIVTFPFKNYKIDDIVNYQKIGAEMSVTHRIVEMSVEAGQPVFYTKGDANDGRDASPVYLAEIKGKVLFWIPFMGYLVTYMKNPIVFIIILILCSSLIIYEQVKTIREELEKEKDNKEK